MFVQPFAVVAVNLPNEAAHFSIESMAVSDVITNYPVFVSQVFNLPLA